MRLCALLLLFTAAASFAHHPTMSDIRKLWKRTIVNLAPECFYGGNQEIAERFIKYGEMPENSAWKCYLKCCHVKLGIFTPTNEVNVKRWSESFDYFNLSLAQKCANIVEPDLCQKSHLMVKCVHDELSKHYPQ